ncbi:MAG: helix-hairpin-helix domain-containing protein [Peptococcaceae bacterium]|nr:helix-hairpin-helix domain-containing protein [Peptococcaceae bacterium]
MLEFFARLREWIEDHVSWKVIGMALVIVAVVAFCGGNLYQEWRAEGEGLTLVQEDATAGETAADSAAPENASGEVVVHVAGAVSSPGVYTLPADSRVDDAVRAADATADADLSQLNLAQKLADGQKITVPAAGEPPAPADNAAPSDSSQSGALVNINTATQEELETLPSIGEVRAQAIIAYREEHGGFRTTDELMEVSGIGEKIFADISPHITV